MQGAISDPVTVIIVTALFGAVGGIGGEVLQRQTRREGDPARTPIDWLASLVLGAIAAVAVLYVLPPTIVVGTAMASAVTTQTQYEAVKLVALAVLAGTLRGTLLTALQSRITAAVAEEREKKNATVRQAEAQIDLLAQQGMVAQITQNADALRRAEEAKRAIRAAAGV